MSYRGKRSLGQRERQGKCTWGRGLGKVLGKVLECSIERAAPGPLSCVLIWGSRGRIPMEY